MYHNLGTMKGVRMTKWDPNFVTNTELETTSLEPFLSSTQLSPWTSGKRKLRQEVEHGDCHKSPMITAGSPRKTKKFGCSRPRTATACPEMRSGRWVSGAPVLPYFFWKTVKWGTRFDWKTAKCLTPKTVKWGTRFDWKTAKCPTRFDRKTVKWGTRFDSF